MRFCVDYRQLNAVTIKDAYPLPRIDESLDYLADSLWFSTLDLSSGYWQVELDQKDKQKTAFSTKKGLYEFQVMPFGLSNAPATFERLMETVLAGLQWQICLIYLDDIIVIGKSFENMLENLSKIFEKLEGAGLKLKAKKCSLFAKEVEYLGHVISSKGVSTDSMKVKAIKDWHMPTTATEVRSFLGLCGYYRRFIEKYAEKAKPLNRLTEKQNSFVWNEDCQVAFEKLKQSLMNAPILVYPDFSKPFILDTDASNDAIGAVLSQKNESGEHVIAYASRTLSKPERKYCVTRKELLAVVYFVKHFRHLLGRKFTIRTDHSSLKWLMKFKNPEGQLARWIDVLSTYDMDIVHRPGKLHQNADAMSRIPCHQCGYREIEEDKAVVMTATEAVDKEENLSGSELQTMQDKDSDIVMVKQWLTKGVRPKHKDIASESLFVKSLLTQYDRLVCKDKILFRKWENFELKSMKLQAIIPMSLRRTVLKFCHDNRTSAHLGVRKTMSRIRQSYYWPGLQRDTRLYISGCEQCSKRKGPNRTKRAPMQLVETGRPMERNATDILGELPETINGNRYILVVSDYYTPSSSSRWWTT